MLLLNEILFYKRIRKSSNILHRRITDKLQKQCWQMKRLPSYLLALLLVCGCSNTSTTPHGFERAYYLKEEDAICAYVKYKQQVGGYDVSAICVVDTIYNGEFYSWHNPTAINGMALSILKTTNMSSLWRTRCFLTTTLVRTSNL